MNSTAVPYEVRWARPEEWTSAMDMIWKTFLKFEGNDYSPEGIRNFLDFITDEELFKDFLMGRYLMMLALANGKVIGVATVRDR
ncbi:MAG: GNAT family N-acetyltransferase, partial [Lachnospiraceae bacterium]|nr:GNAT family N-acetyltransferase [Lachnospiraceae bacterium]